MSAKSHEPIRRRWLRRSLWEGIATTVIALGVAMLMQPFSLTLYGWSFATVLAGTLVFTIATKLPE
jgi:hypothetical protein